MPTLDKEALYEYSSVVGPRPKHLCKICEIPFRYGDLAIRTPHHGVLCETCLESEKIPQGEAVVFGGANKKPSTIDRMRAQRNTKRLVRMQKRRPKI